MEHDARELHRVGLLRLPVRVSVVRDKNPVDLAGAITLVIPNGTGLILSVWFNLCASKLQYHSRLAKEIRSSVVDFVVKHEEDVRRQSMVQFRGTLLLVVTWRMG